MIKLLPFVTLGLTALLSFAIAWAQSGPEMKPRVVKTRYATEDLVIAVSVATESPFGIKGDGTTDDTEALQRAIDAVAAKGGGVLFLPEGRYRLDGQLSLRETVTLRGDWLSPDKGGAGKGTLLLITGGRGDENGMPSILLEKGSGLRDLSLWWPEQKPDEIVPYPWAMRTSPANSGNNVTVRDVTLINAYQGIKIGPEFNELHTIRNLYGTILKVGIWMDVTTDIGRLMSVRFSPRFWETSSLPGAPTTASQKDAARRFIQAEAVGVKMLRSDWEYIYDVGVEGHAIGFQFLPGPQGAANAVLFNCSTRDCRVGLRIDEINAPALAATGCRFEGSDYAIYGAPTFGTIAQFNACTFGGNLRVAVMNEGSGKMSLQNCVFENWRQSAVKITRGALNSFGCDFRQPGSHIVLDEAAYRAHILGNHFAGAPGIASKSTGDVQISHADFKFRKPDTSPMTMPPDPRPATEKLFDVADFGAKSDSQTDNTAAFQKALDAAGAAGGGTVYVPGGNYRFEGRLRVPSGVELRGIFDVPHHTCSGGSVLMPVADRGNADAPPFIALEPKSGLRGLTFWYPDQGSRNVAAYPWTVQSQGPKCWVSDTVIANSYLGVDFGSYPSAGHLVRYLGGAPLKCGLRISKSDGTGWVENVQFNPHYWARYHRSLPRSPENGDIGGDAIRYQCANLDGLVFGRCRDERVLGTFIYAALKGLYFMDDAGGANARVIQHGTDGATNGVTFAATGPKGVELINGEFVILFEKSAYMITTADDFKGKVALFNTLCWGEKSSGHLGGSGEVLIQQANILNTVPMEVAGGKVRLENMHFWGAKSPQVRTSPGIKELLLIGNTAVSGFAFEPQPGKVRSLVGSLPHRVSAKTYDFQTGFENSDPSAQEDTIDGIANMTGDRACRPTDGPSHTGTRSLLISGAATDQGNSIAYYRLFDTSIGILPGTVLCYWIRPENPRGRFVGIDLILEDGRTLRDSEAKSEAGVKMHPAEARGTVGEWTEIRCELGRWFSGHVIKRILVAYDHGREAGDFAARIDDLRIDAGKIATDISVQADPAPGAYPAPLALKLAARQGVTIHYTLDGSTPTESSPVAGATLSLTKPGLIELRTLGIDQKGNPTRPQARIYEIQK